ncbi:glycosyltransferase family 2 protein [Aquirufa sp. ROCK2-A2]
MGNNSPLVTVIIATYNSPFTLRYAIQSVLNQDFQDFEVWVIGDCCNDDNGAVVDEFKDDRLHWFNLPSNSGSQTGPNNEGLRRSRGKYIAFLGHDDLWFSNHLSSLVAYIEETNADLVHSLTALIDPDGAYQVVGPPSHGRNYTNSYVPPSSWLHKKSLIDDCGFWDLPELLSVGVDQGYLNKVALAGKQIQFYHKVVVLKFVSHVWSLYSKKDNFPQPIYFERMIKDPNGLKEEILLDLAAKFSVTFYQWNSVSSNLKVLLANIFTPVKYRSRNVWPLNKIFVHLYQRARRNFRKLRGLER